MPSILSSQPLLSSKSQEFNGGDGEQQGKNGKQIYSPPNNYGGIYSPYLVNAREGAKGETVSPQYSTKSNYKSKGSRQNKKMKTFLKCLGVLIFISVVALCVYEIWIRSYHFGHHRRQYKSTLKMVNLFTRHGDRAPSNNLPKGDRHIELIKYFWPNGLQNLTETGRFRSYKVGLENRRRYDDYLGYNSSNILAYSSTIFRCQESLSYLLRGLYTTDWTTRRGLTMAKTVHNCTIENHHCHLTTGSGSPDEWKKVKVDTKTVPTLVYERLNSCKFRKEHPSPIDSDLMLDQEIKSLVGVDLLKALIKRRYGQEFNFSTNSIWSTVNSELNLVRTQATIDYTNHFSDWVNWPVVRKPDYEISLFDLLEQVVVLLYKNRIQDEEAKYVQNSPIITSIVESQKVALGYNSTNERMRTYQDKRMILYSSHDSVMQVLLQTLNIINFEKLSFEERFAKWRKHSQLDRFLAGLTMCEYSMSARFELWQLELPARPPTRVETKVFNIIQVSIYNKEDAKYETVEYKRVKFGAACRRLFKEKYLHPEAKDIEIDNALELFYDPEFEIEEDFGCPFDLFLNITSELMLDEVKLQNLCEY